MDPYGQVWSYMVKYGTILSSMVPYGPVLLCMVYGPIWLGLVLYGPVWSCMVLYGPVWSSARPIIGIIGIGISVFFRKSVSVGYSYLKIGIDKVKSSKNRLESISV